MSHSLRENIGFVYRESFKKYPRVKLYVILNFFTELLVPFSAILITTLLVYALTNNVDVDTYVLLILGLISTTTLFEVIRTWSLNRYTFENTFTRATKFWINLAENQLKTDYINVEAKHRRKIISKAFSAITSNFYGIEMMLRQAPLLFINVVGMLIYGVLISIYVPIILLILVGMTIVNYYLTRRANKHLIKVNDKLNEDFVEKYYLSRDSTNPNYGKDIRIYKIGDWFNQLFVNLTTNRRKVTMGVEGKFLFANLSNTTFLFIRDIAGYIILLSLVLNNEITLATFTFLIGIVTGFSMWLNGFTQSMNELRTCNIRVDDYRDCIDLEHDYSKIGLLYPSDISYPFSIEFDKVTFSYPMAEKPTLESLSFTIKAGEKVALVGSNGAGKTTIIKLMCGLYKPDSGVIRVDGRDINDFNINEYMNLISVVFQDSEPLSLTIENNIACAEHADVNNEKLWDAIEKSGLKEKISSLEKREQTYITQTFDKSGIRLSGGETQKLMLARSLYKDAPLLILDEPTASLDPLAEEEMYLHYENLVKNSTSLFISHRLSSTKFCDRIIYIDNGKIIEEGTHDELIKLNQHYNKVYNIQAQYYREEDTNEGNQL